MGSFIKLVAANQYKLIQKYYKFSSNKILLRDIKIKYFEMAKVNKTKIISAFKNVVSVVWLIKIYLKTLYYDSI
jgi:hypothetical protein